MTKNEFDELSQRGYSHIPLVEKIPVDNETPLSTYSKLSNQPFTYLFESVESGEKRGRFSIIGLPCSTVIKVCGKTVFVEKNGAIVKEEKTDDPLRWIEKYQEKFNVAEIDNLPRFTGGLVGYFGYDAVRYIESHLYKNKKKDDLNTPDILLLVSTEVVVFDAHENTLMIVINQDTKKPNSYDNAKKRIDAIKEVLRKAKIENIKQPGNKKTKKADFVSGFTEDGFKDAVRKAREYITQGDIMQVVLSQRLSRSFTGKPIDMYHALRELNPSPYMYYLNFDGLSIVGSSPEILVRLEKGKVTVRPIAGTRPRGDTPEEDTKLENDLLSDPKELAEHLMLIDLGRNDIGRVCETGTVKLTAKMIIEKYSLVMHIVSNVEGILKKDNSAMDVLRATFPAGTVSGAPKVRAMEIIDELEPVKRGIYSGAIGYLAWNKNLDTAIAIRTAVIKDQCINVQAGAGIVYDSIPDNEWAETMNKANALLKAANQADQ